MTQINNRGVKCETCLIVHGVTHSCHCENCKVIILVPEQLRRTGRGKSGFERHYTERCCSRKATMANGMCRQHARMVAKGANLIYG